MAHFSDSPGAIYPALKRLRRRGWIEPVPGDAPSGMSLTGRLAFESGLQGMRAQIHWAEHALRRLHSLSPSKGSKP